MTAASTVRNHGLRVTGGLLAPAVLMLAGCSAGKDGTPYPIEPAASSASQSAKAAQLPARPAELTLRDVDLCEIFPQVQLDELQINSLPRAVTASQDGPACVFDADKAEPFHAYHVRAVSADLTEWVTGARRKNSMTTEPKSVGGYPGLLNYRAAGDPADCETLVGVAQGQTLSVQTFAITRGKFTRQRLCELSAHAAELALQSLKTR